MWFVKIFRSSIGRKYIMAGSGCCLGLFLVAHSLGNSSFFWGADAFIAYAKHLHSLGPLIPLFEILLLAIFILHVSTGIILFMENNRARGQQRYRVQKRAGGRSLGSASMIYTGAAILLFLIIHLLGVHFVDHSTSIAVIVSKAIATPLYTVFYFAAMLLLGVHLSHGLWSMTQSMGLNHPRYDAALHIGTWILGGAGVLIFLVLTVLTGNNSALLQ